MRWSGSLGACFQMGRCGSLSRSSGRSWCLASRWRPPGRVSVKTRRPGWAQGALRSERRPLTEASGDREEGVCAAHLHPGTATWALPGPAAAAAPCPSGSRGVRRRHLRSRTGLALGIDQAGPSAPAARSPQAQPCAGQHPAGTRERAGERISQKLKVRLRGKAGEGFGQALWSRGQTPLTPSRASWVTSPASSDWTDGWSLPGAYARGRCGRARGGRGRAGRAGRNPEGRGKRVVTGGGRTSLGDAGQRGAAGTLEDPGEGSGRSQAAQRHPNGLGTIGAGSLGRAGSGVGAAKSQQPPGMVTTPRPALSLPVQGLSPIACRMGFRGRHEAHSRSPPKANRKDWPPSQQTVPPAPAARYSRDDVSNNSDNNNGSF